jgi:hypothetical protein
MHGQLLLLSSSSDRQKDFCPSVRFLWVFVLSSFSEARFLMAQTE